MAANLKDNGEYPQDFVSIVRGKIEEISRILPMIWSARREAFIDCCVALCCCARIGDVTIPVLRKFEDPTTCWSKRKMRDTTIDSGVQAVGLINTAFSAVCRTMHEGRVKFGISSTFPMEVSVCLLLGDKTFLLYNNLCTTSFTACCYIDYFSEKLPLPMSIDYGMPLAQPNIQNFGVLRSEESFSSPLDFTLDLGFPDMKQDVQQDVWTLFDALNDIQFVEMHSTQGDGSTNLFDSTEKQDKTEETRHPKRAKIACSEQNSGKSEESSSAMERHDIRDNSLFESQKGILLEAINMAQKSILPTISSMASPIDTMSVTVTRVDTNSEPTISIPISAMTSFNASQPFLENTNPLLVSEIHDVGHQTVNIHNNEMQSQDANQNFAHIALPAHEFFTTGCIQDDQNTREIFFFIKFFLLFFFF